MSSMVKGKQQRQLELGFLVTKAAAALPQSATSTLYTVAGGSVLVTSIFGQVTTVIQNQVCTLALGTVPTVGTAGSTALATATSIQAKEVGTFVTVQASSGVGGALVVGTNASVSPFASFAFVVPAGTITWTTSASNTGAMKWYLTYIPLDDGASVS